MLEVHCSEESLEFLDCGWLREVCHHRDLVLKRSYTASGHLEAKEFNFTSEKLALAFVEDKSILLEEV